MSTNVTNATNTTESGAAPPPAGGPESAPGLDVARQQLNRVMDMLQNMEMVQQMQQAVEGIQTALQNAAGPAALHDPSVVDTAVSAVLNGGL